MVIERPKTLPVALRCGVGLLLARQNRARLDGDVLDVPGPQPLTGEIPDESLRARVFQQPANLGGEVLAELALLGQVE